MPPAVGSAGVNRERRSVCISAGARSRSKMASSSIKPLNSTPSAMVTSRASHV